MLKAKRPKSTRDGKRKGKGVPMRNIKSIISNSQRST